MRFARESLESTRIQTWHRLSTDRVRATHVYLYDSWALGLILVFAVLLFAGCRRDMMNEPRAKTFSQSEFFKYGASARPLPANVVARGDAYNNVAFRICLTNV